MADDKNNPIFGPGSTTIGTPAPNPPPWVNVTPGPPTQPVWGGPPDLPPPTQPYKGPIGQADEPAVQETVVAVASSVPEDPKPAES